MREFLCKKDYYIKDKKFASAGDCVLLLADNRTVVNTTTGQQKVIYMPEILTNKDYFSTTLDTFPSSYPDEEKTNEDRVNNPSHYAWLEEKCGIKVIDVIKNLDFCKGSAVKYLLRAGYKTEEGYTSRQKEIEDLQKAIWYINYEINQLQCYQNENT